MAKTVKDIAREISREFPDITIKMTEDIIETVFTKINEIAIYDPVKIKNFGTFKVVATKERMLRNVQNGTLMKLPSKMQLKFKASQK